MTSQRAITLFVSYSRRDDRGEYGVVSMLKHAIEQCGQALPDVAITTYIDIDMPLGIRWQDHELEYARKADIFIPVVSAAYCRSDECRTELQEFRDYGSSDCIVPVFWEDSPHEDNDWTAPIWDHNGMYVPNVSALLTSDSCSAFERGIVADALTRGLYGYLSDSIRAYVMSVDSSAGQRSIGDAPASHDDVHGSARVDRVLPSFDVYVLIDTMHLRELGLFHASQGVSSMIATLSARQNETIRCVMNVAVRTLEDAGWVRPFGPVLNGAGAITLPEGRACLPSRAYRSLSELMERQRRRTRSVHFPALVVLVLAGSPQESSAMMDLALSRLEEKDAFAHGDIVGVMVGDADWSVRETVRRFVGANGVTCAIRDGRAIGEVLDAAVGAALVSSQSLRNGRRGDFARLFDDEIVGRSVAVVGVW